MRFRHNLPGMLQQDRFWQPYLDRLACGLFRLHLAVFVEPYLGLILAGWKTVESRFSARRIVPYGCVDAGDVVMFKRSGGPVVGGCAVAQVWFYQLDSSVLQTIRQRFARRLCAENDEFWQHRQAAAYATLMDIEQVKAIGPMSLSSAIAEAGSCYGSC